MTHARLPAFLLALLLSFFLALPAPAADEPASLAPAAWPARCPIPGTAGARGIIRPLDVPGLSGFQPGLSLILKPSEADLADARALLPGSPDSPKPAFEQPGSFIFRAARRAPKGPAAALRFVYISARPPSGDPAVAHIERTWFSFHEPTAESPRGIALLMPGMFGTPEPILNLFITRLTAQGWGVVQMMAQPSRFTQKTVFPADTADLPSAAAAIAAEFDQRAAECAYAAHAAMAHIAQERPALADLPRIAVGMSGGAMTMPSVLALEPDRYAAAIMIAGGCNYLAINEESNYRLLIDAVSVKWAGGAAPTDDDRAALSRLYLERSRLDSYHCAPLLIGKPMLLIHGELDGAVPARLGDLLWERLGKPERWSQLAGHEEVFMKLPPQMDRIMDWLAKLQLPTPAHPVAAPAQATSPGPERSK